MRGVRAGQPGTGEVWHSQRVRAGYAPGTRVAGLRRTSVHGKYARGTGGVQAGWPGYRSRQGFLHFLFGFGRGMGSGQGGRREDRTRHVPGRAGWPGHTEDERSRRVRAGAIRRVPAGYERGGRATEDECARRVYARGQATCKMRCRTG